MAAAAVASAGCVLEAAASKSGGGSSMLIEAEPVRCSRAGSDTSAAESPTSLSSAPAPAGPARPTRSTCSCSPDDPSATGAEPPFLDDAALPPFASPRAPDPLADSVKMSSSSPPAHRASLAASAASNGSTTPAQTQRAPLPTPAGSGSAGADWVSDASARLTEPSSCTAAVRCAPTRRRKRMGAPRRSWTMPKARSSSCQPLSDERSTTTVYRRGCGCTTAAPPSAVPGLTDQLHRHICVSRS
mmetsp:Transcript_6852/g.17958  ORF Transcript_6852/g.17958 Transcript_6852/m.17958 type:complete len:244 (+) Transcript_6852:2380-3111(+)